MTYCRFLIVVLLALTGCRASSADGPAADAAPSPRTVMPFNSGWRFTKDDPPEAAGKLSYANVKDRLLAIADTDGSEPGSDHPPRRTVPATRLADPQPEISNPKSADLGSDVSFTRPDFDDSQWRQLDLPHDWGIEGPFNQAYPGETAKLPYWGVGWYRKHFDVAAADKGRQFYLDVDGAMSYANVWVNGHYVGGWPYGYSSWRVDLTPHVRFGSENVIAVRLDNPPDSSRWYPGGGIYRNVWLVKTGPVHVAHWGTQITTPEVGPDAATFAVNVQIENRQTAAARVDVGTAIYELGADGQKSSVPVVAAEPVTVDVPPDSVAGGAGRARIVKPKLWSPTEPSLYVAVTTVHENGRLVDRYETPFGLRTIRFTPGEGFLLNGKLTEIRGVCLHHDVGALGAAFNMRARERQLEKLKELGCNAIRTSHNPPEPELLDLCDRMGFLVMDEAFDAWRMAKRENDYHVLFDDWHELDLRAMIRRDRNHPSVVMWSLGNEIYEQRDGANAPLAKQLAAIAHEEDIARPVNMALHIVEASTNGFQDAVDVFGYNYTPFGYAQFRIDNPQIPLIGSETSSCASTRGEYFFPVNEEDKRTGRVDFQATSYDYTAPKWAMAPDIEFKGQDENPFVAGEFVWTGFDYLGEPTPYDKDSDEMLEFTDAALRQKAEGQLKDGGKIAVPSRSSYFGNFDLAGFRKDRFYIYQARWRPELPMAHILPHWNWPERVGQVTPVHIYTSGDEAELFLNGRSLGRKKMGKLEYRLRWNDVVYEPGELRVVAYRDGREWASDVVKTTGPPAALTVSADRDTIRADGKDLAFVTVTVVDREGLAVPRSNNRVRFEISGPGQVVATDNGDPTSHLPFQLAERDAFNGLCLAIVRAAPGEAGTVTVRAASDGLIPATTRITSVPEAGQSPSDGR
jgi:beta-galactosidase